MKLLINTLKNQQMGTPQHQAIEIKQAGKTKSHPISWWFDQDPVLFMKALRDTNNNLITPFL